jgi:tetratricopeptide (TPR) repeat protein
MPAAPSGPRVAMLETIREYGSEQLEARAEAGPSRHRHAAWYLGLAEASAPALAGPDAAAWLARLDAEHDNLRAALGWAREQGDAVTALRLAGALGRYWAQRGHLSEGRQWCAQALALPVATGADSRLVRVRCLVAAGRLAIGQAAYDEAESWTTEAVALARTHGDAAVLAAALNTQGLLARGRDRYADAARAHEDALAQARSAGHRGEEAAALLGLAYAAMFTGDLARAGALTEESLAAARASQDRLVLAQALFFLGWGASNAGAYERAEALGTEALGLFADLGEAGEAQFVLGTIALFSGDNARAAACFELSLAERRDRGDEHTAARHLGGLGSALLNLGDLARARAVLEESLVVARHFGDQWSSAMSLTLLGHLRLAEGDPGRARAELAEAAALFAATGNMVYLPWCLEGLAGVAAAGQDYGRAAEVAGARDALRAQTGVLLPPVHRAAYERMLDVARASLGEAGFAAAHGKLAHLAPPDIIGAVMEGEAQHE